jgi:hypothetical protein
LAILASRSRKPTASARKSKAQMRSKGAPAPYKSVNGSAWRWTVRAPSGAGAVTARRGHDPQEDGPQPGTMDADQARSACGHAGNIGCAICQPATRRLSGRGVESRCKPKPGRPLISGVWVPAPARRVPGTCPGVTVPCRGRGSAVARWHRRRLGGGGGAADRGSRVREDIHERGASSDLRWRE